MYTIYLSELSIYQYFLSILPLNQYQLPNTYIRWLRQKCFIVIVPGDVDMTEGTIDFLETNFCAFFLNFISVLHSVVKMDRLLRAKIPVARLTLNPFGLDFIQVKPFVENNHLLHKGYLNGLDSLALLTLKLTLDLLALLMLN